MKKILFALLILCLNFIWIACGDETSASDNEGSSSIELSSSTDEISSSSRENDKSSSSTEKDECGSVAPFYGDGWPIDLIRISSLNEVWIYGNDLLCGFNMEIKTATLNRDIGGTEWEKIGSVDVKKTSAKDMGGMGNVSKYTADFSIFDQSTPLADGLYEIVWGEKENYSVMFHLVRNVPDFNLEIDRNANGTIKVNAIFPNFSGPIYRIMQRGFLIDSVHGITYPLVFDRPGYNSSQYTCKLNEYIDTLADGAYKIRWEFFAPIIFSSQEAYDNLMDKDSIVAWSYAVDSLGNIRDGLYGRSKEVDFFLDRSAPKIVDVLKSEYSVKANDSIVARNFNVKLKLYDDLLVRKSELLKVTCRARRVYAYRDIINPDKDTSDIEISFSQAIKYFDDIYLDIYIEDEFNNIDSVRIENFDVVDSLFVNNNRDRIPTEISYKNYDCTQYKCVSTIYMNPDIEYGEFLDVRDNQVYKTVQIGNQIWMAQNLNFETDSSSYADQLDSSEIHGRIYTWNDAVGVSMEDCPKDSVCLLKRTIQGVCPEGWHVPSFDDFYVLKNTVTELYDSKHDLWGSRLLKSQYGWNEGYSTNETGLSIIPTNERKTKGNLWLSDGHLTSSEDIRYPMFYYSDGCVIAVEFDSNWDEFPKFVEKGKDQRFSVRCLKD